MAITITLSFASYFGRLTRIPSTGA